MPWFVTLALRPKTVRDMKVGPKGFSFFGPCNRAYVIRSVTWRLFQCPIPCLI